MTYGKQKAMIKDFVSAAYGVPHEAVYTKSRHQGVTDQRKLLCYLLRKHLGMSYPSIAQEIGRTDHTTAMHHVRTFDVEKFEEKYPGMLSGLEDVLSSTGNAQQ